MLALLTLLCLGRVAGNGFVDFDDPGYIVRNPVVAQGLTLRGAAWAFSATERANWHPLTWLSHMADVTLFGMRPGGHHLTSLALHTANTLLVFGLLRALSGALWRPALVAALFAVHPLHVESVAWAAERKDLLSTGFALLAALAWLGRVRRGGGVSPAAAALFAAALLAKPMPLTLPALLLLLDWWPLGRWSPAWGPAGDAPGVRGWLPPLRLWLEKAPLLLLAGLSAAVTLVVQSRSGAVAGMTAIPLALRIPNALVSCARYLGLTAWPSGLSVFHPYPDAIPRWEWAGALALLAALSILAQRTAARRPWFGVGWLWFLGTLVPVIGLVQVGDQSLAERYTYLPLVGLFIAIAWAAGEAAQSPRRAAVLVPGALAVAIAALGLAAWVRAGDWRDSETLYRQALRVAPRNWIALNGLGNTLVDQGRLEAAVRAYRASLEIVPLQSKVQNNLGNALLGLGQLPEAEQHLRLALRIDPKFSLAYNNLGVLLNRRGLPDQALSSFDLAVRSEPSSVNARYNLGAALLRFGRAREAVEQLRKAARIDPRDAGALALLGDACSAAGDRGAALAAYRASLLIDPAQPRLRQLAGFGQPGPPPAGGAR